MTKIRNFVEITPNLPFSEFNFYELYRETFEKSELCRMKKLPPLHEMAESFGLVSKSMMPKRGRKSYFTPEGKVALMFLKMKTQMSFPKLMEELNGNIHYQMFCDILIDPTHPLTNYKLLDDIAAELAGSLKIQELQNLLAAAWKPYMKNLDTQYTDATCYESEMRYPTDLTKAIEEKVAIAKSRYSGETKICCPRYGNVMCSRGSVIPLWIDQIRKGNPITLTEPKMTRFIMSLEEAVDLVLFAFEHGQNGDILVQKAPACTIQTQAEAVCELFGGKKEDIKVIGIRHGEKMYETLLTKEECAKAEDMGNFYRVPADNRDLNYDKYFKDGDTKRATIDEFNSDNTHRLNLEETKAKIASLKYIQNELNGINNIVK